MMSMRLGFGGMTRAIAYNVKADLFSSPISCMMSVHSMAERQASNAFYKILSGE
jgi:hypothetical protein